MKIFGKAHACWVIAALMSPASARADEVKAAHNYADILPVLRVEPGARNAGEGNRLGEISPSPRWAEIAEHDYRRHLDFLGAKLGEAVLEDDLKFLREWAGMDTQGRYDRLTGEAFFYTGEFNRWDYAQMGIHVPMSGGGMAHRPGRERPPAPIDPSTHRLMVSTDFTKRGTGDGSLKASATHFIQSIDMDAMERAESLRARHPGYFELRTRGLAYAALAYGGHAHPIAVASARARKKPVREMDEMPSMMGNRGMGGGSGMPGRGESGPAYAPSDDVAGQEKRLRNAPIFAPRRDLIDEDLALLLLSDCIRYDTTTDATPLFIAAVAQAPTMLRTFLRPAPEQIAKLTRYVARPWPEPPEFDGAREQYRGALIDGWWARRRKGASRANLPAQPTVVEAAAWVAATLASFRADAADADGNTPLLLALRDGDEVSVAFLLSCGADAKAVNKAGENTLMLASLNPDPSPLYTLLKTAESAVRGDLLLAKDGNGRTAVELLAERVGQTAVVDRRIPNAPESSPWYVHQALLFDQLELDGMREAVTAAVAVEKRKSALHAGEWAGFDGQEGKVWFRGVAGDGFEAVPIFRYRENPEAAEELLARLPTGGGKTNTDAGRSTGSPESRRLRHAPNEATADTSAETKHAADRLFVWRPTKGGAFAGVLAKASAGMLEFTLPSGGRRLLRVTEFPTESTAALRAAYAQTGSLPESPFSWRVTGEPGSADAARGRNLTAIFRRSEERTLPMPVMPGLPVGMPPPLAPSERIAVFAIVKNDQATEETVEIAWRLLDRASQKRAEALASVYEKSGRGPDGTSGDADARVVEGEVVGLAGDAVVLKDAQGALVTVRLAELSAENRAKATACHEEMRAVLAQFLSEVVEQNRMRMPR